MTPPERAAYLIKELGYERAEAHAVWVANGAEKTATREYWNEVANFIRGAEWDAFDKTFSRRCLSCDNPVPQGDGYCENCKPKIK